MELFTIDFAMYILIGLIFSGVIYESTKSIKQTITSFTLFYLIMTIIFIRPLIVVEEDGFKIIQAFFSANNRFNCINHIKSNLWYFLYQQRFGFKKETERLENQTTYDVEKINKDIPFNYTVSKVESHELIHEEEQVSAGDFVLGIRPEFVEITPDGKFEGEVYSSMPTGMETTVKIRIDNFLVTGVVFGNIKYQLTKKLA